MTRARHLSSFAVAAGLLVPTILIGVNLELGLVLPLTDCIGPRRWSLIASLAGLALTLGATFVSWRALHARSPGRLPPPTKLAAGVSALSGLLFAFTLGLQGAAAWLLSGCER